MAESLDALRFVAGTAFLIYATATDLRERRVPNGTWIAMATVGVLLWLGDWALLGHFNLIDALIAVAIILLAYLLWYAHVLAGGADAKALMTLAVFIPSPLWLTAGGWDLPVLVSLLPPALIVLSNSVLLMVLYPFFLGIRNALRGDLAMPAMFLGYTQPIDVAEQNFVWVMDQAQPVGAPKKMLFPSRREPQQEQENLDQLRRQGHRRVWVTPKIPFMANLLIGYVAAFTVGDVLFSLVARLLA